jgi:hypothetical protein
MTRDGNATLGERYRAWKPGFGTYMLTPFVLFPLWFVLGSACALVHGVSAGVWKAAGLIAAICSIPGFKLTLIFGGSSSAKARIVAWVIISALTFAVIAVLPGASHGLASL